MPLREPNELYVDGDYRVEPSPLVSVGAYVGYLVAFLLVGAIFAQVLGSVDYDELSATTSNFTDGVIIPIGTMAVLLAIATTVLGWWRPVLFEQRRTPRWMLAVPILAFIGVGVGIATADFGEFDDGLVPLFFLGFAFVGFSEELITRGIIVVGFRAQLRELYVWLFSTLMFAGMHSLNAFQGQDVSTTIRQVGSTFVTGSVLYLIRRTSGTLILSMLAHMLFDAAVTLQNGPGSDINDTAGGQAAIIIFVWGAGIVGLIGHQHLSGRATTRSAEAAAT